MSGKYKCRENLQLKVYFLSVTLTTLQYDHWGYTVRWEDRLQKRRQDVTDKETLNENSWRNYTAAWDWAHVVPPKFSNCCDNLHMIPKKKTQPTKIDTENIFQWHCSAVDDIDVLCETVVAK